MSNGPDDFRTRLIAHAKTAVERAGRAATEAATNQYLVMPFVQLLGYDPLDPDEIIPEAHASFSEKFRNRVDFAICQNHIPVIAMESKKVGTLGEAHRGELKGYFNAVATVKLGILTDGLTFQLFTDTNAENMMDDEPFAVVDLSQVAQELVDPHALDALNRLRKGTFDPANVGSDARRKMNVTAYASAIERSLTAPDERFIRVMMDLAGVDGRRTTRLMEEHGALLREAAETVLDRKILERVGFAERSDLVRMRAEAPAATPVVIEPGPEEAAPPAESGVVTTAMEQEVFDYVRTRLPFLIERNEGMFRALANVRSVDHKTVFCVYYKQERKGKLFDFRETVGSPRLRFAFAAPEGAPSISTDSIQEIDAALLAAFNARAAEMGA
jgi:predicted type IV restriction endonuclease